MYFCGPVDVVHADEAFTVLFMVRIIVSRQVDEADRERLFDSTWILSQQIESSEQDAILMEQVHYSFI